MILIKPQQSTLKSELLCKALQQWTDMRMKVKGQNRWHLYKNRGVSLWCPHYETIIAMWIVILQIVFKCVYALEIWFHSLHAIEKLGIGFHAQTRFFQFSQLQGSTTTDLKSLLFKFGPGNNCIVHILLPSLFIWQKSKYAFVIRWNIADL